MYTATGRTTTGLNLRAKPGTSNPVLLVIPGNTTILLTGPIEMVGDTPWYQTVYGQKWGFVSGAFVDTVIRPSIPESVGAGTAKFLSSALRHLGCLYIFTGNGPYYFDCSGFTGYVLSDMGFCVKGYNKTADAQMEAFRSGEWKGDKIADRLDVQPGDIAFFGSPTHASHCAFWLSPDRLLGSNGGFESYWTPDKAIASGAGVRIDWWNYRFPRSGDDLIEIWRPLIS